MQELTIRLDPSLRQPLYEQIYTYIKEEIQNGGLPRYERLPSTRRLAAFLEVSRSTVTLAYEQLLSEGYIENRPCSGYYVNDLEGLYRLTQAPIPGQERKKEEKTPVLYDFSPSGVDLASFPHNAWRKISRKFLLEDTDLLRLGAPEGEQALRETIASYVHQARGVSCRPEQIVVGAGNDYLLMLLDVLLGQDTVYALENPTYKKAFDIFTALGRRVCPVAMDSFGMCPDALQGSGANAAYVMPSHQYPLGIVMPAGRRLALLKWASERADRYLIEDDYDSEFRYRGKPIPALQGFDTQGRVVYLGTFSKSIAPAIRISFLILPPKLLERYREVGRRFSSTVSRMDQRILAEFIRGGYYERHLNRMRSIYRGRHDALLEALGLFKGKADISGEYAGTHLLLTLRGSLTEQQAIGRAAAAQVRVAGLSSCRIADGGAQGADMRRATLILGYAHMDEGHLRSGAEKLYEALAL